jgi:hypothetical protein
MVGEGAFGLDRIALYLLLFLCPNHYIQSLAVRMEFHKEPQKPSPSKNPNPTCWDFEGLTAWTICKNKQKVAKNNILRLILMPIARKLKCKIKDSSIFKIKFFLLWAYSSKVK